MTKRMLIDGTHPEELRVVITNGNRLDEYDVETSTKTQLKGNIYLAKVTRVEPSLQAAFVDYGGNRHGFLAFSEIHPDYYQIPVEDREALKRDVAQFEANASAAQAHIDEIDGDVDVDGDIDDNEEATDAIATEETDAIATEESVTSDDDSDAEQSAEDTTDEDVSTAEEEETSEDTPAESDAEPTADDDSGSDEASEDSSEGAETVDTADTKETADAEEAAAPEGKSKAKKSERRENPMRRYKIQEVIKRRQILLVQVVKEERGNKGAALTTYMSLAGRYCVLMPNTSRSGGGVSRKITSSADRRRLRDLLKNLNVSEGMGVIMRTAGMERNKSEIKRDFDYLTRLWENVRELTLQSAAPALVYEEGDLIKRAIRDLYTREIEEILVEGNDAYTAAKKLMRMMMPSHAKRVQPYRDETIPLYHRYQVETQLESMHSPIVQLKSGGYIVINPTEALVAIDVNSGRSTRERNIEETAYKTNLEAASEVGRQLRLRDLAGLIVIDFIDMDVSRNQRGVERRLKEAVKTDRARIQLGRISNFGLFELSRQRMRPSIVENSTETCVHCEGTGYVRSTESTAVHVLRSVEEEGIRNRSSEIAVTVPTAIALYILNQKRDSLTQIEGRYNFRVNVLGDNSLVPPDMRLERLQGRSATGETEEIVRDAVVIEPSNDSSTDDTDSAPKENTRKRRPRRRRKNNDDAKQNSDENVTAGTPSEQSADTSPAESSEANSEASDEKAAPRRRRRGRRGGRRRNQRTPRTDASDENKASDQSTDSNNDDSANTGDSSSSTPSTDTDTGASANAPVVAASESKPEAVTEPKSESSGGAAEPAENSEASPKRGWWQRITQ
ncbi:MAG: Rne/Rng family ribonuclease [Alphaproteobacteria bacterium]|nr:Rne/Rng family ribonuclease [Alphaproteobacteria bacterium]